MKRRGLKPRKVRIFSQAPGVRKNVLYASEGEGVRIRSDYMRGIDEEAPEGYKDVHEVAEVTEKAGSARRVAFLRTKVCIKG